VALAQLLSELLPTLGTPHLTAAARRQLLLAADTDFERRRAATGLGDLVLSVQTEVSGALIVRARELKQILDKDARLFFESLQLYDE
jgi:hypothetical protein